MQGSLHFNRPHTSKAQPTLATMAESTSAQGLSLTLPYSTSSTVPNSGRLGKLWMGSLCLTHVWQVSNFRNPTIFHCKRAGQIMVSFAPSVSPRPVPVNRHQEAKLEHHQTISWLPTSLNEISSNLTSSFIRLPSEQNSALQSKGQLEGAPSQSKQCCPNVWAPG